MEGGEFDICLDDGIIFDIEPAFFVHSAKRTFVMGTTRCNLEKD